jgi:septal ring factor EnvC (AmiA/AmiB activator)
MKNNFNTSTAKEQIARHTDMFDTLKEFVDLVNDPARIADAHIAHRKELELTAEQAEKYADAVEFMSQYEQMAAELKAGQEQLKTDQETLAGDVESFKKWRDEETTRLGTQDEEQKVLVRQLEQSVKDQGVAWAEMKQKYSDAMTPIDDMIAQNEKDKEANEQEAARLEKLRTKLEKKAAKLKETLADDDEEIAA